MKLLVLLINMFFSLQLFAQNDFQCLLPGKVKIQMDGNQKIEDSEFCINHSIYRFISFSCIKNQQCEAIKKYTASRILPVLYGEHGSPFHRKCYMVGGSAQLIEYFDDNLWIETGICKFNDGSFISVFNNI